MKAAMLPRRSATRTRGRWFKRTASTIHNAFCKKRAKIHLYAAFAPNSQRTELTYENIFLPAGNDCNAQFGFVFVAADDDHNNDNSRNHSDTADDNDTAAANDTAELEYARHSLKSKVMDGWRQRLLRRLATRMRGRWFKGSIRAVALPPSRQKSA
jgi:hypothetical protein